MFFEVSDWKNYNDVIIEMTPEDEQRWKASQPSSVVQAQLAAKSQLQKQAAEQKSQLIDQQDLNRAGRDVLRRGFEQATEPLATAGEPGGKGFGSEP
jgi:ABC-type xylose transport system substrate-binding protein